jgi:uncharacterized membrane protein
MAHMRGGIRTTTRSTREKADSESHSQDWREERAGAPHGNVGQTERFASGLIGGGLLFRSVTRPMSPLSGIAALAGIALVYRALTGYCPAYHAMGVSTQDKSDTSSLGRRKVHTTRALKIEESVEIDLPAQELYAFWRKLDNLPTVMSQVRSVEILTDRKSHWVVNTLPGSPTIEWDAEIINDVKNELIGWKTLQVSSVDHAGSVQFHAIAKGRTKVTVSLQYDPPAGPIGAAIAAIFGQAPGRKIASDLERFKQTMESQAPASKS